MSQLTNTGVLKKSIDRMLHLRRELHKYPELANREKETMRRLADYFEEAEVSNIRTGVAKTGIVAVVEGHKKGKIVGVRVPMDAFPIDEANEVPYKSLVPNVSHACGHDAMMAMAAGTAEILAGCRDQLVGDVRFIFQPAEEGIPDGEEGGALLMIKEGVLDGISALISFHVDSDIPSGKAGVHLGPVYAGAQDWEVIVYGVAAHGATPWKGVDAIAVSAQIISGLQLIASRQADIWDPIVLSIGSIHGGTARNGVAAECKFVGTLRTYSEQSWRKARENLERITQKIAEAFGAKAEIRFTMETPPTLNDHKLVKYLKPTLEAILGASNVKTLPPLPYKDDFAFMAEKVPSFYFQLGVRNSKNGMTAATHSANFEVDEAVLPLGARLLAALTVQLLRKEQNV